MFAFGLQTAEPHGSKPGPRNCPNIYEDPMKNLTLALACLFSATAFAGEKAEWKSLYTDVKKDCVTFASSNDNSEIDFFSSDCKSFGGYRLQITGGDIRYAPQLSFNGENIDMGTPLSFHDLGSDKVEWIARIAATDTEGLGEIEWKGFVYRLSVAKEGGEGSISRLFAVRLDGASSCFLGNPASNEAARALIRDANAPCVTNNE